ncbi:MAG: serine/threonine protein kinase [Phycisphaerae bacterium]|nr:serine/threonine protein kinase [Phycisphaerae bacterium]
MTEHDSTSDFPSPRSPVPRGVTQGALLEGIGSVVGPYKLLEVLGEGGFGTVYLSEQREPVTRRVALKILKPGMDSREVLARFEAERQALALMDHPNVATIFDAGMSESGRPYFAMEHVRGVPLTEYCDQNKLTTRERLELFIPVCHAVQHAHQKGIIHRDIKPSNVLVTLKDGRPMPKVIDFGVAKAVSQRLSERTIFTEQGRLLGTPEYMSPEQAGTTGLDVDTRTDIYSLGVVLYQLLSGSLPFDSKTLRRAGFDEIVRIIREEEPPKLSTRLSDLGELQTEMAQKRRSNPRTLVTQLRGELEWITMRSMEKDRTRRYPTAQELAEDVRRYLDNEPVLASPPSLTYRARKFVRRHRVAVFGGLALGSVLLVGLVGTTAGLARAVAAERRATRDRDAARLAQARAETAEKAERAERDKTEQERQRAEREAAKSQAVSEYLRDLLASADPQNQGRDVTVRQTLERSVDLLATSFRAQPETRSAVRQSIALTYMGLGAFEQAEGQLREVLRERERVFGAESVEVAESLNALGLTLYYMGNLDAAEREQRRSMQLRINLLGPGHHLAAESMNDLALVLRDKGNPSEAEVMLNRAIQIREKRLGATHGLVGRSLANLAVTQWELGKHAEAERSFASALDVQRSWFGAESLDAARTLGNFAQFLNERGNLGQAEPLLREALAARRALQGDQHPEVGAVLTNLGLLLQTKGDLKGAEPILREALGIARSIRRPGELPSIDQELLNLGNLLYDLGKTDDATGLARHAVELARRRFQEAPDHRLLAFPLLLLGRIESDRGDATVGEALLREAERILAAQPDQGGWVLFQTRSALGGCLTRQGKLDEAGDLLRSGLEGVRAARGDAHLRTRQAIERLAVWNEARGDLAEAARLRATIK